MESDLIYCFAYVLIGVLVATITYYVSDDEDATNSIPAFFLWPVALVVLLTLGIIKAPTAIRRARRNHGERKFQRDLERERRKTALAAERAEQARLEAQALHSWMPPQ